MLEKLFHLKAHHSDWRREVTGGITTFMTMAYIIFVQPLILGAAGMDPGSVLAATCIASALGCFLMAFLANYPIGLAPGMGTNVFFAYSVVVTQSIPWEQALGAVFYSGLLFILLSFFGFREAIINSLPQTLRLAIAVGIGFLISVVGLEWSGIVVDNPATLVSLGDLSAPPVLLSLLGLGVMTLLLVLRIRWAILAGILLSLSVALAVGLVEYEGIVSPAPSLEPTFLRLDFGILLHTELLSIIFVFFFLDLFDTVGTLTGVAQEAGLLRSDGSLPRARQALLADAVATVSGSFLGTSTVTSYVESSTGITAGARTGLASVVTGILFLLALFFSPLLAMVGGGFTNPEGLTLYPVIAPALIVVGCFLMRGVRKIDWEDYSDAFPAFLTIITMPLTFSITEGISFGFISYVFLKSAKGQWREIPIFIRIFAILFVLRYIFLAP